MVPIEALLGYVLLLVGFVFFANGIDPFWVKPEQRK